MKIKNKTIVVTGGGSGLGRELVLELLARGASVAVADIDEKSLNETIELAGEGKSRLSVHVIDITDREAVQSLPEKVIGEHGAIDGIINNAGIIQPFVRINDLDYEAIERVMNINFYGALYITKAFLPHLLERPEAHVVNISSMGGFLPVPGQSIYGASKAALKLFTEGLYAELLDTSVRVTIVFPGAMRTNIAENSGVKMSDGSGERSSKALAPDKAAIRVLDGMEKDCFRILVGSDASFMDRIYRLSPKYATNMIYKRMKDLLPDA